MKLIILFFMKFRMSVLLSKEITMKKTILISIILITSINLIGQTSQFTGNETWLYKMTKSESYNKTFEHPNNSYYDKINSEKISIYYAVDGYWKFVGELGTSKTRSGYEYLIGGDGSSNIYFKNGYRVAYSINGDEPIEIKFEEKQWKVK